MELADREVNISEHNKYIIDGIIYGLYYCKAIASVDDVVYNTLVNVIIMQLGIDSDTLLKRAEMVLNDNIVNIIDILFLIHKMHEDLRDVDTLRKVNQELKSLLESADGREMASKPVQEEPRDEYSGENKELPLSTSERRNYHLLKLQKDKMDMALQAAVKAGLHYAKLKDEDKIDKDILYSLIGEWKFGEITKASIEKIYQSLPEKHKRGPGEKKTK